ncbi:MAG: polyisoprenoid-binding protein YceI [Bacteriovoracaceae bacterium]|jgi:polyisoprenoid-binding protein YceI
MKFLIFLTFLLNCTTTFALNKSISIDVELSPAGSFKIESKRVKGKVYLERGNLTAKNIKVLVKNLKTGIDLRDKHLKKKLEIESNPKASLTLLSAQGKNGKGTGIFKVLGKTQESSFTYKKVGKSEGIALFSLSLKKFGISGISYMGVGVQDKVTISVTLPFIEKQ